MPLCVWIRNQCDIYDEIVMGKREQEIFTDNRIKSERYFIYSQKMRKSKVVRFSSLCRSLVYGVYGNPTSISEPRTSDETSMSMSQLFFSHTSERERKLFSMTLLNFINSQASGITLSRELIGAPNPAQHTHSGNKNLIRRSKIAQYSRLLSICERA